MVATQYGDLWADLDVADRDGTVAIGVRLASFLRAMKDVAVASGLWVLKGTWTVSTWHASNDLILTDADMAGGGWVLEHVASGWQWSAQHSGGTGMRVKQASPSSKFAAVSAARAPTASGQQFVWGGGADASPTYATVFNQPNTPGTRGQVVCCPDVEGLPGGLGWFCPASTASNTAAAMLFISRVVHALAADTDQVVVLTKGQTDAGAACFFWGSGSGVWSSSTETGSNGFARALGDSTLVSGDKPICLARVSIGGKYKGLLPNVLSNYSASTPSGAYPNTLTDATAGKRYCNLGHSGLAFRFPSGQTATGSAGAGSDTAIRVIDEYSAPVIPDTTPPEVRLVSPASLANLGRNEPFVLEFEDDQHLAYLAVYAIFPELGIADIVLDGDDPDLQTKYDVVYSVVMGLPRAEILMRGGWPRRRDGTRVEGFIRTRLIDGRGNKA